MHRTVACVALLAGWVSVSAADEPLPGPRVIGPVQIGPSPPFYAPPMPYRVSRYQHWQYYGVNWAGEWVPRVIDTPHGAFYAANGQPYYWVPTHTRQYMPYAAD